MWEQYVDGGGGVLYDLLARCVNVAPPLFVSFVYVSFEFYVSLKKKILDGIIFSYQLWTV